MIVVQFRVVILHRVPISIHNIFFNPLYSPKPLQILQILQILQSYRHLTNVQAAQGPRYFFVHLAQVAALLRSAGAGKSCGGRPRLCVFRRFCMEKFKFLGQKKSSKICSPTRHRGQISFMAWNRVKWQEESGAPRRRVPASHSPKCRNRLYR